MRLSFATATHKICSGHVLPRKVSKRLYVPPVVVNNAAPYVVKKDVVDQSEAWSLSFDLSLLITE